MAANKRKAGATSKKKPAATPPRKNAAPNPPPAPVQIQRLSCSMFSLPREQSGPQTGERYEYQYLQAAAEALSLLHDPASVVCIYCDWHDDYVVEYAAQTYRFHQVKTRNATKGPWDILEFFGVKRRKVKGAYSVGDSKSIFAKLQDHALRFGSRCDRFLFVTDNAIDKEFEALLTEVQAAKDPASLNEAKSTFELVYAGTSQALLGLTEDDLFQFLKRLEVREGMGKRSAMSECLDTLAMRIADFSEVTVHIPEARRIGSQLVGVVRRKSHESLPMLPPTFAELRAKKGVIVDDLLGVLSLSEEGYHAFKTHDRETVRALSRLQRLCAKDSVAQAMIKDLASYKSAWDGWWLAEQLQVEAKDFALLKADCLVALQAHSEAKLTFRDLMKEGEAIVARYSTLATSKALTLDVVLGFIIALWVECPR